jgi:hypothetical protein
MKDVLELYAQPYDPDRPDVGFDERPLELVAETRIPLTAQPGRPRRIATSTAATARVICSRRSSLWPAGATSK